MPDPEIHIIDASGAGPLDWPIVAEKYHHYQQQGIKGIELKIPNNQHMENIVEFIAKYCSCRCRGLSAEELSNQLKIGQMILKNARNLTKTLRARPGAPSRGGDQG